MTLLVLSSTRCTAAPISPANAESAGESHGPTMLGTDPAKRAGDIAADPFRPLMATLFPFLTSETQGRKACCLPAGAIAGQTYS